MGGMVVPNVFADRVATRRCVMDAEGHPSRYNTEYVAIARIATAMPKRFLC
jgi:hypothetical protein